MNYIKQTRIENVVGFCPHNGDYSYEKKGRRNLVLDGVILEKGEAPCALSLRGTHMYVWYASGRFELYRGHVLVKEIGGNTNLLNEQTQYIGTHLLDLATFQTYYNYAFPIDEHPVLSDSIPYMLYVEDDVIIAYDNFRKKEIRRIDNKTETLWSFPFVDLGEDNIYTPGKVDHIVKILGVVNDLLWFSTQFGRLVALDVATGKVVYQFSGNPANQDKVEYTQVAGLGDCFFREADRSIVCISYLGVQVINATTGGLTEGYMFLEADPDGIGRFDYIYAPNLQGDYFTFLAEMKTDWYGIGRVGIFDLKARKLLWTEEIIPFEERKATRNHLVTPQPLYISGDKLYIKDVKDTLHIFQRE